MIRKQSLHNRIVMLVEQRRKQDPCAAFLY